MAAFWRMAGVVAACAVVLAGCETTPSTTETTGPALSLKVYDFNARSTVLDNVAQVKVNKKGAWSDTGPNLAPVGPAFFNYLITVTATDQGGVASTAYNYTFLNFGACNPNSDFGYGTQGQQGTTPVPKNPDGTARSQAFVFVSASGTAEAQAAGCGKNPTPPGPPGVYEITVTATNYSGISTTGHWIININDPQLAIPMPLKG